MNNSNYNHNFLHSLDSEFDKTEENESIKEKIEEIVWNFLEENAFNINNLIRHLEQSIEILKKKSHSISKYSIFCYPSPERENMWTIDVAYVGYRKPSDYYILTITIHNNIVI
jgi:hypothetical protein